MPEVMRNSESEHWGSAYTKMAPAGAIFVSRIRSAQQRVLVRVTLDPSGIRSRTVISRQPRSRSPE
jgi:hypothetical protein